MSALAKPYVVVDQLPSDKAGNQTAQSASLKILDVSDFYQRHFLVFNFPEARILRLIEVLPPFGGYREQSCIETVQLDHENSKGT